MSKFTYFEGIYEIQAFPGKQPRFRILIENQNGGLVKMTEKHGGELTIKTEDLEKFEPQFICKYNGQDSFDYDPAAEKAKRFAGARSAMSAIKRMSIFL